ncbi:MAG: NAD-dependent epimerase/dehydratase family protein [Opitutales bacterium]
MEQFYKDKPVAVTGGLGLIGSFLVTKLLEAEARVILVDDESKGTWHFVPQLRDRVDYRHGTLEDPDFAEASLEGAEVVFHLASRAYGVGYSQGHHFEMFRFNDRINTNTLDAIAAHKPRQVLLTSTSCVYSDDGPTPMPDSVPWSGEPERANWGYGWAKRMLEMKADIYKRETSIPMTIVRPFNIYGEHYNWAGEYSQAIPMLVKRVLDGENPCVMWGSGNQRRNYVHAEDCARIMMALVEKGFSDRPVNIGFEDTIAIRDLVALIAKAAGLDIVIEADRSKPEGRFIKSSDSKLLTAVLGSEFKRNVSLEDGMRRMVGWYQRVFAEAGVASG